MHLSGYRLMRQRDRDDVQRGAGNSAGFKPVIDADIEAEGDRLVGALARDQPPRAALCRQAFTKASENNVRADTRRLAGRDGQQRWASSWLIDVYFLHEGGSHYSPIRPAPESRAGGKNLGMLRRLPPFDLHCSGLPCVNVSAS